ncbi:hypothetical protein [Bacillus subtilis]|uniref:hypothetical protein n=1 Tax=Bacillus subtilis TaxID=1423 RepID=UPI0016003D12|nr:hypothetical protein [Bacillus subtilis]
MKTNPGIFSSNGKSAVFFTFDVRTNNEIIKVALKESSNMNKKSLCRSSLNETRIF